jgi:hypothetical protein
LFNDYCYFANVPVDPTAENALWEIMPELPYGNDNYTVEAVFDPSQISGTSNGGFVAWGKQGQKSSGNSNVSNGTRLYTATATQPSFRHYWWDNDVDVKFTDAGSSNIKNFAITYDNRPQASPNNRTFYYNGSTNSIQYVGTNCGSTTNHCREKTDKNTAKCGSFFVGSGLSISTKDKCCVSNIYSAAEYTFGTKLFSIRVYKGALTPKQIADNYDVDKRRFTSPPTVMFGTEISPEVIVLSNNFLMCKVPVGAEGNTDVTVDGEVYPDAYRYVAASEFHISGISPIIGPATGETVTLTGNNLNEITGIEVDNTPCPILSNDGTVCTVTLPAHGEGEVDIVIITASQTYRLAKVFEYKD